MSHFFSLFPDNQFHVFPEWVPTPAGTLWSAINSGVDIPNDTTFIQDAFGYAPVGFTTTDPTDATYLASAVAILGVRPRVRIKRGGSPASLRAYLQLGSIAGNAHVDDWAPPTSITNYAGQTRTTDPAGKPWTKATVQNASVVIYNNNNLDIIVYEVELQVFYVLAPSTSGTGPSGAIGTANPILTWDRTHDEGLVQAAFDAKVFDSATFGRGDFDPDRSPAAAASGITAGSAQSWQTEPALTGVLYYGYVRTAVQTAVGLLWSAWAPCGSFSISTDPPAVPSMRIEPQPDAGRVRLDLTALDNLLSTNEADFERTSDVATWAKAITNMTVAQSNFPTHGSHALGLTKTVSTADMAASTGNGYYVNGAEPISARVHVRNTVGTTRSAKVSLLAFNAGGILAVQDGAVTSCPAGVTTVKLDGFVPPAGTLYVTLFVTILAVPSGETWHVDSAGIFRGLTAPAWSRGGLWTRNILTGADSDFESGVGSWVAGNTNTTVAQSATFARFNTNSMRLTAGVQNAGVLARTDDYPVTPGEQYVLLGSFRPGAGSALGALGIEWFDGNGASLGVVSEAGSTVTAGAWSDHAFAVVAPAGAATGQVLAAFNGALTNATLWYVDAVELERWGSGAMPAVWSRGQDSSVQTWLVVECSDDGGLTWGPIRGGDLIVPDVFQRATIFDYEVPPNTARQYRARTESTDPFVVTAPARIASPNTPVLAAAIPTTRWWLKSLTDPTASMGFGADLCMRAVAKSIEERSGRFDGVGAKFPVFTTSAVGGEDGTLDVVVYSNAQWAALKSLLTDPAPLLLVDPIEQAQFYVKLTARSWDEVNVGSGPRRQVTVGFVEVAKP